MGMDNKSFKDLKHAAQMKREHNKRYSTKLLSTMRVNFHIMNNGYHIKITELPEQIIDFWPSTGLWKIRQTQEEHRGIQSLIEYLNKHGTRSFNK